MIIFGNPLNAAVRKVRTCAALRKLAVEEVSVLRGSDDQVFRSVSAAGVIPAISDGDIMLCGQLAIVEYLDSIGDTPPILRRDPLSRARALSLTQIIDGPFAQSVNTIFQNCLFLPRFVGKPGNLKLAKQLSQRAIPRTLLIIENQLSASENIRATIGLPEVSLFAQYVNLLLAGQAIDLSPFPTISKVLGALARDPDVIPILRRDFSLAGMDHSLLPDEDQAQLTSFNSLKAE